MVDLKKPRRSRSKKLPALGKAGWPPGTGGRGGSFWRCSAPAVPNLLSTDYRLLSTAASAFFVFFTPSASKQYKLKPKNTSKNAPSGHSDTRPMRKNALEIALFRHVSSQPPARSKKPSKNGCSSNFLSKISEPVIPILPEKGWQPFAADGVVGGSRASRSARFAPQAPPTLAKVSCHGFKPVGRGGSS